MNTANTPIRIVADAKESRSGVINHLKKMVGYEIEVRNLDTGDYLVGEQVIVERKAAADFVASITDGRFVAQSRLMTETFGRVVYVVEGDLNKTLYSLPPESLHGALSFLAVLEGISVIPSAGIAETASLVATMARHAQQGLGYVPPLRVQKPKGGETAKLFLIEGLPGIGGKKSREILAYFGSVSKMLAASREEWLGMPGMGKGTVEKVFAVLHD